MPRRTVLGLLAAVGAISPAVAGAVEPERIQIPPELFEEFFDPPGSTLTATEGGFTSEDVDIDSFDGTTISATVFEPTTEGPHPAIMLTHGWGGNRGSLSSSGESYASAGYVTLTYDSRGFGNSEGKVSVTGENERRDASALIDWLAERDSVLTDGENNPRVGMDGSSYGGGIQSRTAAEDDRVDAIVPRASWFDLVRSLAPNDVLKVGWVRGLLSAGMATGDPDEEFLERGERVLHELEVEDGDREYFRSRSAVAQSEVTAPTLVLQQINDRLFPGEEGVDLFHWARDSGVDAALVIGNGTTHTLFGPNPPGRSAFRNLADEAALAWFDDHLKGDRDHGLAPVNYYNEATDEFVETEEWPPESTKQLSFTHELETTRLDGPDAEPVTVDFFLDRDTEFVGRPTLSLDVTPIAGDFDHLMAALQHVTDDEVTTIKDQVKPVLVEEEGTVSVDLSEIQATLQAGDVLRVALATNSEVLTDVNFPLGGGLFFDTPEGTGVEIGGELSLTVPGIESEQEISVPPVADQFDPPQDLDGDGLYEDIRGTGDPSVADVQALFENLHSPRVQENAEAFNFSGTTPDRVTVFDVQALFTRIEET